MNLVHIHTGYKWINDTKLFESLVQNTTNDTFNDVKFDIVKETGEIVISQFDKVLYRYQDAPYKVGFDGMAIYFQKHENIVWYSAEYILDELMMDWEIPFNNHAIPPNQRKADDNWKFYPLKESSQWN
jgi:hypothetical protein